MALAAEGSGQVEVQFHRASDLLCMGPSASARDVVNVLGRYSSYSEWERVGELKKIDALFDASGKFKEKRPAQQSSGEFTTKKKKGNGEWVQATPERRGFCLRNGLTQRYWHGRNVGLLPFTNRRLASSVGITAAELNATPLNPLALDIVFDGLSASKSGIIQRELHDARRASYTSEAEAFVPSALAADLSSGRTTVLRSFLIFPGSAVVLQGLLFYKLDGWTKTLEYLADSQLKLFGTTFF